MHMALSIQLRRIQNLPPWKQKEGISSTKRMSFMFRNRQMMKFKLSYLLLYVVQFYKKIIWQEEHPHTAWLIDWIGIVTRCLFRLHPIAIGSWTAYHTFTASQIQLNFPTSFGIFFEVDFELIFLSYFSIMAESSAA